MTFEEDQEYQLIIDQACRDYKHWLKDCEYEGSDATWSAFIYAYRYASLFAVVRARG